MYTHIHAYIHRSLSLYIYIYTHNSLSLIIYQYTGAEASQPSGVGVPEVVLQDVLQTHRAAD